MTNTNNLPTTWPLGKQMLAGAAIGLAAISFFVLMANNPPASWGKYWMIRPLLLTPTIAALGGTFFYFMGSWRAMSGWRGILGTILSIFGFIVALWMGTVLGLAGTMWN